MSLQRALQFAGEGIKVFTHNILCDRGAVLSCNKVLYFPYQVGTFHLMARYMKHISRQNTLRISREM